MRRKNYTTFFGDARKHVEEYQPENIVHFRIREWNCLTEKQRIKLNPLWVEPYFLEVHIGNN